LAADEATRTFAAQKCRFTLPGPDWKWSEKATPNSLFFAVNTKGFVVTLSVVESPKIWNIGDLSVKDFEKTFYVPGKLSKQAGRFITFRGLQCYQLESSLADGRTGATRILFANKSMYNLSLIGSKDPIEADPAFETILNGFDFTVPPEQGNAQGVQTSAQPTGQRSAPSEEYAKTLGVSQLMGKIVGACLIGIVLLLIIRSVFRKKKSDQS
jgi:hypothetical protein